MEKSLSQKITDKLNQLAESEAEVTQLYEQMTQAEKVFTDARRNYRNALAKLEKLKELKNQIDALNE